MTLGRTVLFLTWCIPEFSLYLVCRGVCETTPSRVGKMLVSVTSSAILPLFSFLVICLCVSRDHSCPEKTSNTIKTTQIETLCASFLPNTEQQKTRLYFGSSWSGQLNSLAGIAGSFPKVNPKVQQERLWETHHRKLSHGPEHHLLFSDLAVGWLEYSLAACMCPFGQQTACTTTISKGPTSWACWAKTWSFQHKTSNGQFQLSS